ncbi:hypothetical protein [Endozoicomonas sp. SCSIO W0465]|uniref:hypothetical protein n=1 Tax=Endozoicomonas sp. SCSIO W0465 TaxID=2918516 RepID=UPI00207588AB|nr:hypothetical protein [Endozoicomonas sp. SCSIO W0465]USE36781.1 hypothetical protein MJO57_00620 [Endozoicomonas sp. SCSIO W0465]
MADEDRFNRIEEKLDGITQILQTLAKHDERMVNLALREQRSEERLDTIEKAVQKNSVISSVVQWVAMTVTAALIAYAFRHLI